MKGILKVYHPEETLRYNIKSTYCKAVYNNSQHVLEVEIITDESLDHVDDDSLQYKFPQMAFEVTDLPIAGGELAGKTLSITGDDEVHCTSVDLFDDEEAYIYNNELVFSQDGLGELNLIWKGMIDDFYTGSQHAIPFKLKCSFRQDDIEVDE